MCHPEGVPGTFAGLLRHLPLSALRKHCLTKLSLFFHCKTAQKAIVGSSRLLCLAQSGNGLKLRVCKILAMRLFQM
jgi:hypothetical protein